MELLPGSTAAPLHCRLSVAQLTEKPHYEALSYVWGYPLLDHVCFVNGKPSRITRNLCDALYALRLEDAPRYLWVDAVCINQDDVEEKGRQVGMMDDIYRSASEVLVWLGFADEESRYGIAVISYFTNPVAPPTDASWYSVDSDLYASGLSTMLMSPWFSRIWTIQEAALARKITVICGTEKVSWSTDLPSLKRLKYKIKLAAISPQWENSPLRSVDLRPLLEVVEAQLREAADVEGHRLENNLLDVVYEFRDRYATDPRDKIYAMFNLAEGRRVQLARAGDYTESRDEAWERLARAVKSQDPAVEVQTGI